MNLSMLSGPQMIILGQSVLGSFSEILSSESSTAWMVPSLELAQEDLHKALEQSAALVADNELKSELKIIDKHHDFQLRALFHLLKFAEQQCRSDSPARLQLAKEWATIRMVLVPDGLDQVNKSYLLESSEAAVNFAGLSMQQKQQLRSLKVLGSDALACAERYVAIATQLGCVLKRRASSLFLGELEMSVEQAEQQWKLRWLDFFRMLPKTTHSPEKQVEMRGAFERAIAEQLEKSRGEGKGGLAEGVSTDEQTFDIDDLTAEDLQLEELLPDEPIVYTPLNYVHALLG